MMNLKRTFLLVIICITGFSVQAQESNDELLKKLVEKNILTQQEADDISKESPRESGQNTFVDKAEKIRDAFNTPYMNFGGYGMLLYKYNDMANIKHDIQPRVLFMNMAGKLPNNIGYFVLFEFVDPRLYELYAEWTPTKEFNLRVGQMKVPFTIENPFSLTVLETVPYARSVSALVGMSDDVMTFQNGINNTGRDIGIQVSGSLIPSSGHDLLEYSMGVFQGAGLNSSDRNNSKDFAGTILLQPVKGWRIGGGAYFGESTYSLNVGEPVKNHVRNRWTLGTEYNSERLYCRAEWIRGKDGNVMKEGLYGLAQYYLVPQKFNIAGKADYYSKSRGNNVEVMDYTLALNYFFYPRCRVQLNYTYSDYSKAWDAKNSNLVQTQLQVVF